MPTVLTIAVPTYQRRDTLRETLNSVLSEIRSIDASENIEVLVIDNNSTLYDFEHEIVQDKRWESVKFQKNNENFGIDGNVKKCIQAARGNFIWLLSDDDLLFDGAVRLALRQIERHPKAGLIVLNYSVFDAAVANVLVPNVIQGKSHDDGCVLSNLSFISSTIINGMLFKEHFESAEFDEYLNSLYYHMALAVALAGKFGYSLIEQPCVKFRSGSSALGGSFKAAVAPYVISCELNKRYDLGLRLSAQAFMENNVLLFIKHQKKAGLLKLVDVIKLFNIYGLNIAGMEAFMVWLLPLRFLFVVKKIKTKAFPSKS